MDAAGGVGGRNLAGRRARGFGRGARAEGSRDTHRARIRGGWGRAGGGHTSGVGARIVGCSSSSENSVAASSL
jgi:hypothetical protein